MLLPMMLPSATLDGIIASEKPLTLSGKSAFFLAILATTPGVEADTTYTGFVVDAPLFRALDPFLFRPPYSWRLEAVAVVFLKVLDDFPRRLCRLLELSGVDGGLILCRL